MSSNIVRLNRADSHDGALRIRLWSLKNLSLETQKPKNPRQPEDSTEGNFAEE